MMPDTSLESDAIGALFDSGEFGLAMADAKQIVYFTRGKLAEAIVLHKPLCQEFPPLVGMTRKVSDLQTERAATLTIPRVSVVQGQANARKISIEVLWSRDAGRYTILIHPASSDEEEEIARTLRIKRLAEKSLSAGAAGGWQAGPTAQATAPAPAKAPPSPALASLTARERDVVRLLICGHSNKTMARILSLSPKTVEAHRARAMKRLGLKSSAELIKLAVEAGWPE
jgi:DNA-binding CsgD family transcriptional regulator